MHTRSKPVLQVDAKPRQIRLRLDVALRPSTLLKIVGITAALLLAVISAASSQTRVQATELLVKVLQWMTELASQLP